MSSEFWALTLGVFGVSALSPLLIRPLLERWRVVDVPNERSSHTSLAIRGMGLAPAAAILIGGTAAAFLSAPVLAIYSLAGAIMAAAIGWLEDYKGLSVRIRLTLQMSIAVMILFGFTLELSVSPLWIPIGALAVTAYINMANFMDGINGISGMHGFLSGLFFVVVGTWTDRSWLTLGGAVLAAAFLAFLPWNLIHGRMFLGDVGSYLLGALTSSLAIAAFLSGLGLWLSAAPLMVYIADTLSTLIARILKGQRWHEAHRSHAYQRLTNAGLSHVQVSFVVSAFTVAVCGLAWGPSISGEVSPILATSLVVLLLVGYLALPGLISKGAPWKSNPGTAITSSPGNSQED